MKMADECWEISTNYVKSLLAYQNILAHIYRGAKEGFVAITVMLDKVLEDRKSMVISLLKEEGFECEECGKSSCGTTRLSISWYNYVPE